MIDTNKIALIGSNYGRVPDPNATSMLKYLERKGTYNVFILTGKNTMSYWNALVGDRTKIINRNSLRALSLLFKANFVLYTHSLSDIFPHAHHLFRLLKPFRATLIFLQHGVIGLKINLANGVSLAKYLKSLQPTFDIMVVSSAREARTVAKLGVNQSKIAITGLPRFETPNDKAKRKGKTALVFFTWQDQKNLRRKLRDIETIKKHFPKICFESKSHFMTSEKSSTPIDPRHYDFVISDDSSIAWDFLYFNREAVFYKPSEWLINDPALDERKAFTPDDLIRAIYRLHAKNMTPVERNLYTDNDDNKNCQRIENHLLR